MAICGDKWRHVAICVDMCRCVAFCGLFVALFEVFMAFCGDMWGYVVLFGVT